MNDQKYSVLMSVYYKENPSFLRESLLSMFNQTVKPDEIILVKDGLLTDELEEVINEFSSESLKIISLKENVGLGKALNIGLNKCKNELIARMDTDDISRKDRCERQLDLFKKNNLLSIVSSAVAEFDKDITTINTIKSLPTHHEDIIRYSKKRNPFTHPAVMYKKSDVIKAGGYKHFNLFEDYYLWARMILNGSICHNINEPLLYMRANTDMFKRRGGYQYFKDIFKFKYHLKKIKFYSTKDFLISSFSQGLVALLPNSLRIKIYSIFLRKKVR